MELVKEIRILVPKMGRNWLTFLLYVNVRIREINKLYHLIADTASFGNSFLDVSVNSTIYIA